MPFKNNDQALFLQINHPDIFKRWKAKYGLPKDYHNYLSNIQKGKSKLAEMINYPTKTIEQTAVSHRKVHKNHTPNDTTYYHGIHKNIVKEMMNQGMTHNARMGDTLDHMLPKHLKARSRWKEMQNAADKTVPAGTESQ